MLHLHWIRTMKTSSPVSIWREGPFSRELNGIVGHAVFSVSVKLSQSPAIPSDTSTSVTWISAVPDSAIEVSLLVVTRGFVYRWLNPSYYIQEVLNYLKQLQSTSNLRCGHHLFALFLWELNPPWSMHIFRLCNHDMESVFHIINVYCEMDEEHLAA